MAEPLKCRINGKSIEVLVDPTEMLSTVIRSKAGCTGTKEGCRLGSCGACTILLNNKPVLSCITPALRCQDADIITIEGIANMPEFAKLQSYFVERGAIQCGFCTPGMVITAIGFINELDLTLGYTGVAEQIKKGISGNLCRCTGYTKIIQAITDFALSVPLTKDSGNSIHQVGKPQPYIEAGQKVQGYAQFADDIASPNALHCKFLRSPYPHAKIISIDCSAALALPGVHYVVTGKELPIPFGVLPISQDETAMGVEKLRYIGEIVAAVAADTEEIAEQACKRIRVKYQPLQPFLTIEDSLADAGDKELIHPPAKFNNNVHKKAELRFGDQQSGLAQSDIVASAEFEFKGINHGFTEPHAAMATWDHNGLTITTATQVPHYLHRALAKVLQLPLSRVRVIKPFLGGGFGGKSDPFPHEIIVSYLAMKTGRSVRCRLNREEVFLTNHGRHPSKMKLSMGADSDGNFTVLDADIAIDGGAYGSFGVVTSYYNGVLLQAPYKLSNFGFRTYRVYTNKPQCGAMRGHGAVNSRFATETLIDEIAEKLDTDPIQLRMKNLIDANSHTVGQYRITSNGSREALHNVKVKSDWDNRWRKLPYGHGLGVASGFFISGSALPILWNELPQSVVHLKVDFDGRVLITSGSSDIGQGSDTMLAIIVAEVLGLQMDQVFVLAADTLLTPVDLGSYSSRVTFMAGNAARDAAENLKSEIIAAIAAKFKISSDEVNFSQGRISSFDQSVNLDWLQAIDILTAKRGAVSVSGKYISPKLGGDFKGAGAGLSPSYSFGACVAEVKVNTDTGCVEILHVWGAHDCGKALNPLAVEGQLEGSWHMGTGQAWSEQMMYLDGRLLNANFLDYKIPLSMDTPDIHTGIIETLDPEGPFGAKETGEGAIHPVIPAIINAIHDAVGIRIRSLPVSPEHVLELLQSKISEKI